MKSGNSSRGKATKKDAGRHKHADWVVSSKQEEMHGHTIYGCLINPYTPDDSTPIFLTVADRFMHFYEVPSDSTTIKLLGAFECTADQGKFFTATWCFDTYEASKSRNPYMAVGAGTSGEILVVDSLNLKIVNTLPGHGLPINELRTSSSDSNMFASASADRTIRIFHIRQNCALIVLGGPESHIDQILSIDWSDDGRYIVSCGMDHCLLQWDLHRDERAKWILDNAREKLALGERNSLISSQSDEIVQFKTRTEEEKIDSETAERMKKVTPDGLFHSIQDTRDDAYLEVVEKLSEFPYLRGETFYQIYYPTSKNIDTHLDYVDCVRHVGDYVLSKGSGKESVIKMSRFGPPGKNIKPIPIACQEDGISVKFTDKAVPNGETWFIKFDVDPTMNFLACGNNRGDIAFFEMNGITTDAKPIAVIDCTNVPIRQVSFSNNGRVLIGAGEKGRIVRLDRKVKNQDDQQPPSNNEETQAKDDEKIKEIDVLDDLLTEPLSEDEVERDNMLPLLRGKSVNKESNSQESI